MRLSIVKLVAAVAGWASCAYPQTLLISLTPATQHIEVDSPAAVRIRADEVQHLHAYSVQVGYDKKMFRCARVRSLNYFGSMTFFFSRVDSLNGKITIDEAILGPSGKSGSGEFAELTFVGLRDGSVPLTLQNVDLRDTTNTGIPTRQQGAVVQVGSPTGVSEGPDLSGSMRLLQNYPNPFNPSTTIRYARADGGRTILKIYSVLGEEVFSYIPGFQEQGEYSFLWDGRDPRGQQVPSGTYFARVETEMATTTLKMLLVR